MSRTSGLIVVAVILLVTGSFAAIVALAVLLAPRNTVPPAVTAAEASVVVAADDFAPYFQFPGDRARCERWRKSAYSDGETLYKYDYDLDHLPETDTIFRYSARTNVCPVKQMAVNVFNTRLKDAYTLVSLTKNNTLQRRDELLALGDERFVAMLLNEFGEPDGMVIAVRKGGTVVSFRMIGHVIQDKETLAALIAPKLPPSP